MLLKKNKTSYYVYVLISIYKKRLFTYVGYTNNLDKRLKLHNCGKGAKYTRGKKWKILYTEIYKSKNYAMSREYSIKKNRKFRNELKKKFNENINFITL